MSPVIENIYVFKTNINTETDAQTVSNTLNRHKDIHRWSVDINDIDRVLRVVSNTLQHHDIITLINQQGFQCSELE